MATMVVDVLLAEAPCAVVGAVVVSLACCWGICLHGVNK